MGYPSASREVIEAFDRASEQLRREDLDEANTFHRLAVNAKVETWDLARSIVIDILGEPEEMYDPCPRHPLSDRFHGCPDESLAVPA